MFENSRGETPTTTTGLEPNESGVTTDVNQAPNSLIEPPPPANNQVEQTQNIETVPPQPITPDEIDTINQNPDSLTNEQIYNLEERLKQLSETSEPLSPELLAVQEKLLKESQERQQRELSTASQVAELLEIPGDASQFLLEHEIAIIDEVERVDENQLSAEITDSEGNRSRININPDIAIFMLFVLDIGFNHGRLAHLIQSSPTLREHAIQPLFSKLGVSDKTRQYFEQGSGYKNVLNRLDRTQVNTLLAERNPQELFDILSSMNPLDVEYLLKGERFGEKRHWVDETVLIQMKEKLSRLAGWQKSQLKIEV